MHKTSLKPSQSIEARIGLRRETVEYGSRKRRYRLAKCPVRILT